MAQTAQSSVAAVDAPWLELARRHAVRGAVELPEVALPKGAPSFAAYDVTQGASLAVALAEADEGMVRAMAWCEKLLRVVELRRHSLCQLAKEKWGRAQVPSGLASIAAVLAEATLASGDWRYCNAALKLLDRGPAGEHSAIRKWPSRASLIAAHAVLATEAVFAKAVPSV